MSAPPGCHSKGQTGAEFIADFDPPDADAAMVRISVAVSGLFNRTDPRRRVPSESRGREFESLRALQ